MAKNPEQLIDLALLEHALSLNKDLEMSLHLTKLARTHLIFPIKTFDQLAEGFSGPCERVECRNQVMRWKDMRRFVKPEVFPITDERDFLSKAYLTLCIGTECHHHERRFLELRGNCCEETKR